MSRPWDETASMALDRELQHENNGTAVNGSTLPRHQSHARIMAMEFDPPTWAVKNILREDQAQIVYWAGAPKVGKTSALLGYVGARAMGGSIFGLPVKKTEGRFALFLAETSREEYQERMRAWFPDPPALNEAIPIVFTLEDLPNLTSPANLMDALNRCHEAEVREVVLDNLLRIFSGWKFRTGDGDGPRLAETLRKFHSEYVDLVHVVHHTRKAPNTKRGETSDLDELSGDGALAANLDVLLMFRRPNRTAPIALTITGRRIPDPDPIYLKFGPGGILEVEEAPQHRATAAHNRLEAALSVVNAHPNGIEASAVEDALRELGHKGLSRVDRDLGILTSSERIQSDKRGKIRLYFPLDDDTDKNGNGRVVSESKALI